MSEHKTNPVAQLHATLPPLLPPKIDVGVALSVQVLPQERVLLVAPGNYRPEDNHVKLHDGTWQELPEGMIVHVMGTELPVDLCDAAVVLGTFTRDTLAPTVLMPGRPPEPKMSSIAHGAVLRIPLADFQKQHLENLRGGVTS